MGVDSTALQDVIGAGTGPVDESDGELVAEEEEDVEFLQEALDNLDFTDELSRFDLLEIEPEEDE